MTHIHKLIIVFFSLSVIACSSSAPKTQYYSLFATQSAPEAPESRWALADKKLSFGINPVTLPEFMDNPGVVSVATASNQVRISDVSAWAGDLKDAIVRVMATDLANYWQLQSVWAFPWDNRVRPEYQIRVVFEEFSGVRGGAVYLKAKWVLLNKRGDKQLQVMRVQYNEETPSDSSADYVVALNDLLNKLNKNIAENIYLYFQG